MRLTYSKALSHNVTAGTEEKLKISISLVAVSDIQTENHQNTNKRELLLEPIGHVKVLIVCSARNGPAYAGIPYRNFFLFLNFTPAIINIYCIHLSFSISMTIGICTCFVLRSIPAFLNLYFEQKW
jgi:hypothetical protein